MDERPRDVFAVACNAIADRLAPHGFTYARSTHVVRRARGPLVEAVAFQSSHNNSADVFVAMWPHVLVRNPALGRWRTLHSPIQGDWLAGTQLGYLLGSGWATWDLADPATRDAVVDDLIGALQTVVLPFFALVGDTSALVARGRSEDVPGFEIEHLVDYLVYLERPEDATAIAAAWWERRAGRPSSGYLARLRPVIERHGLAVELPAADPA